MPTITDSSRISFQDLALAGVFIYAGCKVEVQPPADQSEFVTFSVLRTPEVEQSVQDYVISALRVDPRRYYDALRVAKRLAHRAKGSTP